MIPIQCALCGKRQKIVELYKETINRENISAHTFSARRMPDRMHFRFVKCMRCGLIFSNPIFDTKKLEMLYKKSDFRYETEAVYLKKTYIDYLQENIQNKYAVKYTLLEIGCGNGFFLEEASKMGFNVFGVEPGRKTVLKARPDVRKKIIVDILKPGLFPRNMFDVICCFHTLDHIVDVNTFIAETRNLLKKKGIAFFIVHNTDGFSVKLLGEKSPIFDVEHIYLFNKKNLSAIFKNNGFRIKKVFDIYNTYPLLYWSRLFPFPSFLKTVILEFLSITHFGLIPIKLNAGNIGIIAQKI